jgi:hypothetical protein
MATTDPEVFGRLRTIMAGHARDLVVVRDEPGDYYLNTRYARADGYVWAFGAVQTKARYVSYHLMLIGSAPDLLGASDALRMRMQGKSCFNFTRVDEDLFAELNEVTARAARLAADRAFFPA